MAAIPTEICVAGGGGCHKGKEEMMRAKLEALVREWRQTIADADERIQRISAAPHAYPSSDRHIADYTVRKHWLTYAVDRIEAILKEDADGGDAKPTLG